MEPMHVVWEGTQFVYHSLALVNRELCLQLMDAGHEVSIIPYEPSQFRPEVVDRFSKLASRINTSFHRNIDIHICHQWPPKLTPPSQGHWVVMQPWEWGSLPKNWVKVFSDLVDEIWVPSHYVRQVYFSSGVPIEQVRVIPNGVNSDIFHPGVKPMALSSKKRFKFLFVGGVIYRKGIDILLEAYISAFHKSDNVSLIIKDMGGNSFYREKKFRKKIDMLMRLKDVPEIIYIDKIFSENELAGLYTACNALVHPYRGEGFGLPILEAMSCGIPPITTNGGACLDYCNEQSCFLVKAEKKRLAEKRIANLETVKYPWFYEVNIDDLKCKMLYAYQHEDKIRKKGLAASKYVCEHWTWKHSAQKIQERLFFLKNAPIRRYRHKMVN